MAPNCLKHIFPLLLSLCSLGAIVNAQSSPSFTFKASSNLEVSALSMPWTGGFNACHFASIDLNHDQILDLVSFDRLGFRLRPFIFKQDKWEYAPEYIQKFPPIHAWVQFHDYNADGYPDLFTFNGVAGIAVYKNTSAQSASLSFELVTKSIPVLMFASQTSLYCTNVDYPIFADIDQDGDLDILNFWVPTTGDYLLYYKNMSQETYHHSDSLCFIVEDWSWGCFAESNESNVIYLDTCQTQYADALQIANRMPQKHSGSTLFALQKQGIYDILIGDVDYPNLIHLSNDGTLEKAHIGTYQSSFPEKDPVQLNSFPVVSTLLLSGEKTMNLLASPFAIDPFQGQGRQSIWRYSMEPQISGIPQLKLIEKDFLQNQTLDMGNGAYPIFVDLNADGLQDLLIGNYNRGDSGSYAHLVYYQNKGSIQNPRFTLEDNDFAGVSAYKIRAASPSLGDINGDGKLEMFVGTEQGQLLYFTNQANTQSDSPHYVLTDSLYATIRVGSFASPQLFDLNQDGLLDLIIGEKRKVWKGQSQNTMKGNLNYYQNIGDKFNPVFELISDSLGGVDVIDRMFSNFGYARPCFYRNLQNETFLFCGSENGKIYFYDEIDANLTSCFHFVDFVKYKETQEEYPITVGIHSSPSVCDINGDGMLDLLVGNQAGGLEFFEGIQKKINNEILDTQPSLDVTIYPIPTKDNLYVQIKEENVKYAIYDMRGQCVLSGLLKGKKNASSAHLISLQTLFKGVFVLVLSTAQGQRSQKIIKI
ncbi:MAG: FG-GAP-like repeat-containing protein [Bacteroidales bacterium]